LDPFCVDDAGSADDRLADACAFARNHVERHDVLSVADVGFARERGTVTGRQHEPIACARPSFRKPIRISREQRVPDLLVSGMRRDVATERSARDAA
jgi:hypothetical protein